MAKQKLSKEKPVKNLVVSLKKSTGRSSSGRITVRHRGGGVKKKYRLIDFKRERKEPARILYFEYDPYRTAFIALIEYPDGEKSYILAPQNVKEGDFVVSSEKAEIKPGNRMKIKNIPIGTSVYNVQIEPGRRGGFVRSAGSWAKVLAHEGKYVHLEMPSKEIRKVHEQCLASVGAVSNPEHRYKRIKKAGVSRRKNRRPVVRGSAMNPVDHPHGGGEGRAPIGLKHPKTPWGKIARGVKTRRRKNTASFIIKRRKKKKR
jgi:large subunit ribosomal protein L2